MTSHYDSRTHRKRTFYKMSLCNTSKSVMKIDYKALFHQERRKNEYLTSVINVYKNNHNVGVEKDEVLLLLKLMYFNKNKKFEKLTKIFGDEASEGIEIIDQDTKTEVQKYQDIKKMQRII